MAKKADNKDFFISRNKADREWAQWIAWQLEEAGYTSVLQDWDFRPGQNFVLKMHKAAMNCERTIAVLSADYLAAEFSASEWAAAFVQDPTGKQSKLLTVRVRDCEPPGLLRPVIYIDLVGLDEADAKDALLEGVKLGRVKPSKAPGFPGGPQPRFPGALPPIWNVPHRRNPNFTGREDLLSQLREKLNSGEHAAVTQAISGLGGVGKTQLATEYAYRCAADYERVWWVRSEEPAKLAADYAGLAAALDLPGKEQQDQRAITAAVRGWLDHNGGWLLVFDNVPAPEQVRDYLPRAATGHVIVTSRNPTWGAVASPLSVEVWEREESVEFLVKRTEQDDKEAAGALADQLGNLPLALEEAAAYIGQTGCSLSHYLELYRERHAEVLARGKPPEGYEYTVAATWDLSFQRVEEENPAAAELLNLCAFLAPEDIPLGIFQAGAQHLPERLAAAAKDDLAWNDVLAALQRYSLAEVSRGGLSVHRLVQAVLRDRLPTDDLKRWATIAVRLVNSVFPDQGDEPSNWLACGLLLQHGFIASAHARQLGIAPHEAGRLLNNSSQYLRARCEFLAAKRASEQALAVAESEFGKRDGRVAAALGNLGSALVELGDAQGARAPLARALQIDEANRDASRIPGSINNLGMALNDSGDLPSARRLFQRAVETGEVNYGPNHPKVAVYLNNLANVMEELGDPHAARAMYERALAIDEAAHGSDDPVVATRLSNLGLLERGQGNPAKARSLLERAVEICERVYGVEHVNTAVVINNLGLALADLGDRSAARSCHERSVGILLRRLGDDHPKTVLVRKNLEVVEGELRQGSSKP